MSEPTYTSDEVRRVFNTLYSGAVLRYHAAPSVKPQPVSSHAWGVMIIAAYINPYISAICMLEAALHDSGELLTGDTPFDAKRDCPELRKLINHLGEEMRQKHMIQNPGFTLPEQVSPDYLRDRECQRVILKLADYLEGLFWCVHHEDRSQLITDRWIDELTQRIHSARSVLTGDQYFRTMDLFTHLKHKALK